VGVRVWLWRASGLGSYSRLCGGLEYAVADDQPGCVVLGCDPPAAVRELLPIHMPEAHAMRPLVADPLASLAWMVEAMLYHSPSGPRGSCCVAAWRGRRLSVHVLGLRR